MLDMQTVKELNITEGDVRTIHDSSNNLLWGRLAYDTKYAGDTTQQTYSGKNLIDNTDVTYDFTNVSSSDNHLSTLPTGIRYRTTFSSSGVPVVTFKLPIDLTQYIGKVVRMKATFGDKGGIKIAKVNETLSTREAVADGRTSGGTISWTVPNDLGDAKWLAYSLAIFKSGGEATVDFTDLIMTIDNSDMAYEPYTGGYNVPSPNPDYPQDIQVVTGEQTVSITDDTNTHSYTVDLTSKNLIAPANIHNGSFLNYSQLENDEYTETTNTKYRTIKIDNLPAGTYTFSINWNKTARILRYAIDNDLVFIGEDKNTFTFTSTGTGLFGITFRSTDSADFTDSDYTVQLEKGSHASSYVSYYNYELCKIGTYQDYIYKSGDDWYVHKACGKIILNGSETWYRTSFTVMTDYKEMYSPVLDNVAYFNNVNAVCNSFSNVGYSLTPSASFSGECFSLSLSQQSDTNKLRFAVISSRATDASIFKTWLSEHNTTIYYALATPTDTKITDSTLVSQLNAVHEWLTRYGYNATVTGNLPIIINQTNL